MKQKRLNKWNKLSKSVKDKQWLVATKESFTSTLGSNTKSVTLDTRRNMLRCAPKTEAKLTKIPTISLSTNHRQRRKVQVLALPQRPVSMRSMCSMCRSNRAKQLDKAQPKKLREPAFQTCIWFQRPKQPNWWLAVTTSKTPIASTRLEAKMCLFLAWVPQVGKALWCLRTIMTSKQSI